MEYQMALKIRQDTRESCSQRRLRLVILTLCITLCYVLGALRPASADIVDCRRATVGETYTIYIDEPSYAQAAFSSDQELKVFLDRLWFLLDQDRERHWLEGRDSTVKFVICRGRRPSIDGQEFDQGLVDLLYNQDIILEIWGTLNARVHQGQIQDRQAHISYLIVPVQFARYSDQDGPSGIHILRYPERGSPEATDFLEFFKHTNDIDAFVAVGLGIKSLRVGNFDLAQGNLCKAKLLLEQLGSRKISSRQRQKLAELSQLVTTKLTEVIHSAQTDNTYGDGPLGLLDPAAPCPTEEAQP